MVRGQLIIFLFFGFLFSNEIVATADNFFADEKNFITKLSGNVIIKKNQSDTLWADLVTIFLDKNKKPIKYEAKDNAKFQLILENKNYEGSAKKLIFDPQKQLYIMSGDAFLFEKTTDKKVYGKEIIVDQKQGTYEVKSDKNRPVKIIFKVEK